MGVYNAKETKIGAHAFQLVAASKDPGFQMESLWRYTLAKKQTTNRKANTQVYVCAHTYMKVNFKYNSYLNNLGFPAPTLITCKLK